MAKFYVTFPQRIPFLCDSFSVIYAKDQAEARKIAFDTYDRNWAFMYEETDYADCIGKYKLQLHQTLGTP